MIELGTAVTALSVAKNIIECSKSAIELINKLKGSSKNEEISELRDLLNKMRENSLTLKEEYFGLLEENQNLRTELKVKTDTYFDKGVFWGKDGSGPYCPACLQSPSKTLAYLTENDPEESESWVCTVCGKTHESPDAQKRKHKAFLIAKKQYEMRQSW